MQDKSEFHLNVLFFLWLIICFCVGDRAAGSSLLRTSLPGSGVLAAHRSCFHHVWQHFFWKYCRGQTIRTALTFHTLHQHLTTTGFTGRKCLEPAGAVEVSSRFTLLTFLSRQWVSHRLCAFCTTELHHHPHRIPVLYIHADVDL